MSKKKGQKLSLGAFLHDESTGEWADEVSDLPTAPAASIAADTRPTSFEPRERSDRFERDRPQREDIPLPNEPPFTAYIGNLSFATTEADIRNLFSSSKVVSIRILVDSQTRKPKGFGYAEFETRQDLEKAIAKNGSEFNGRTVRVNVAEGTKKVDKFSGNWREKPAENAPRPFKEQFQNRSSFGGDRPNPFGDRGDRPERQNPFGDRGDRGERQNPFGERRNAATGWPKRDAPTTTDAKPPVPKPKVNPFGAAAETKQRDQYAIEQEIERRRQEREAEKKTVQAPTEKVEQRKTWGSGPPRKDMKKKEDSTPTNWREKKAPTEKSTGESYTPFGNKRKPVKSTVSTAQNSQSNSVQGSQKNLYEVLDNAE